MPTRIPIYKNDLEELSWKIDQDIAGLKDEMNRITQLILDKLQTCERKEVKKPIPSKKLGD